eukprot:747592-Hanusia_phi.AAC.1
MEREQMQEARATAFQRTSADRFSSMSVIPILLLHVLSSSSSSAGAFSALIDLSRSAAAASFTDMPCTLGGFHLQYRSYLFVRSRMGAGGKRQTFLL